MIFTKIFFLISLILISIEAMLSQNCVFHDCTCTLNTDHSLNIYCAGFKSSSFPNRTFNNRTLKVKYLVIENYNLKSFPEDKLYNLSIETLRINMNNIETMPKNSFRGLISLKKIEIREYRLISFGFGLFDSISLNLTGLDFSYSGLTNERFNKLFNSELFKLANLNELNLSFNDFVSFEEKWALDYSRLKILNLGRNNIFELKEQIFDSLITLTHLDLSYNHFSNLSLLSKSLKKASSLESLNLRGNSIQILPTWPTLNLTKLDLSENNIKRLFANSFSNLTYLTDLILKSNKITSIDPFTFVSCSKLSLLQLSNNFLSSVPNIINLNELKYLDLSNQNGNLTSLGDNSFDRSRFTAYNLTVNLKSNTIKLFGNKTFCSKYSNIQSIEIIEVNKQTFSAADKCIFSQLSQKEISKEVTISIQKEQNTDYSNICGCNSKVFFNSYKIKLDEACNPSVLNCSCFFLDDCKTKPEYKCDLIQTDTTFSVHPINPLVIQTNEENISVPLILESNNRTNLISPFKSNSTLINASFTSITQAPLMNSTFIISNDSIDSTISMEESLNKTISIADSIEITTDSVSIDRTYFVTINSTESVSNNFSNTQPIIITSSSSSFENEYLKNTTLEINSSLIDTSSTLADLSSISISTSESAISDITFSDSNVSTHSKSPISVSELDTTIIAITSTINTTASTGSTGSTGTAETTVTASTTVTDSTTGITRTTSKTITSTTTTTSTKTTTSTTNTTSNIEFSTKNIPLVNANLADLSIISIPTSEEIIFSTSTILPITTENSLIEKSTTTFLTRGSLRTKTSETIPTEHSLNDVHVINNPSFSTSLTPSVPVPSTAKYRTLIDPNNNSSKNVFTSKILISIYFILIKSFVN